MKITDFFEKEDKGPEFNYLYEKCVEETLLVLQAKESGIKASA